MSWTLAQELGYWPWWLPKLELKKSQLVRWTWQYIWFNEGVWCCLYDYTYTYGIPSRPVSLVIVIIIIVREHTLSELCEDSRLLFAYIDILCGIITIVINYYTEIDDCSMQTFGLVKQTRVRSSDLNVWTFIEASHSRLWELLKDRHSWGVLQL